MKIKFFKNERGYKHADWADEELNSRELAWFLNDDIQADDVWCRQLIQIVENIQSGEVLNWEGNGNAHVLTLRQDGAEVENLYDESLPKVRISLSQFKQVIEAWLQFIKGSNKEMEIEIL